MNTRIIREIIALEHKSIDELRAIYERLFSKQPESNAGSPKLIPEIAYRLQEITSGTLKPEIRERLEAIANGGKPKPKGSYSHLTPGTKICRLWHGVEYHVEITKDGCLFQGQPFRSFSAVATLITGVKTNGPKFFGLRRKNTC